jgi:hypothetical protein
VRESARSGVRAPGGTLSSGDVPGVMSRAGLVLIGRAFTTYVHACTNDASKCAAGAYQGGAVSALPQSRHSHVPFPSICVIVFHRSRRPSRNAQEDTMGMYIVHGRLMVEGLSYAVEMRYSILMRRA